MSELDVPRYLQLNTLYELPFGPGKAFLSSAHGVTARLVGGWQIGGILSYRSGYPLVLTVSVTGGGTRPKSNGQNANLPSDRPRSAKIAQWFNTTDFLIPTSFTYGNVSRTLPNVRGLSLTNIDFTLLKDTQIAERINLQFRAEAFNVLNTPHLWEPNSNINTVQFGQISSTTGNPRVLQLALKLLF